MYLMTGVASADKSTQCHGWKVPVQAFGERQGGVVKPPATSCRRGLEPNGRETVTESLRDFACGLADRLRSESARSQATP